MRESARTAALAALLAPASAWALPWNVDMVDSPAVKAYERPMAPLPEGVVSQPHVLTPMSYRRMLTWQSGAAATLTNPLEATPEVLATGQRMWDVYCWPCHGSTEKVGPVAERWPVVPRLLPPSDPAATWDDRLTRLSDGHIFLTMRAGSLSTLMRPYSYAMTDDEMWAVVTWLRTQPGLSGPAAAPDEGTPADGTPSTTPAPQETL